MSRWLKAAGLVTDDNTPLVTTPKPPKTTSVHLDGDGLGLVAAREPSEFCIAPAGGKSGFGGFGGFDAPPFDPNVDPMVDVFEERAAILEYDAGLPRIQAEARASQDAGFADIEAYRAFLKRHGREVL